LTTTELGDLSEDVSGRGTDLNLMSDTTQKGFIDQILGIQIGRKHNQLFKRDGKFFA